MGFQFRKLTCVYKEKFKEIAYKSKQMPGGKLSRLAGTKFNFHVILEWDPSQLDGVAFHPSKPGSCNHHLRTSHLLTLPKINTKPFGLLYFSFCVSHLRNQQPDHVKCETIIKVFKNKLVANWKKTNYSCVICRLWSRK